MKVLIFTKPDLAAHKAIEKLITELSRRSYHVDVLNWNTARSQSIARLYDVHEPGAVVVTRDDGAPVTSWRQHLPTAADVSYSFGYV